MRHDIVIQQPATPQQLMLLFHGVGASPAHMQPVGNMLARSFPQALIVSVAGADESDLGQGFQWFSVQGVTEANRPQRIADALPAFVAAVEYWQQQSGLGHAATALLGFSQGAIMALEAAVAYPALASRVLAFSGRFASLPARALPHTTIHLFHGKADPVIPYLHSVQAAEHLLALGGDVTAEIEPFVGHQLHEDLLEKALEYLQSHIPKHVWDEAMSASPQQLAVKAR
ncbi:phospholipase/carboxylesterase family protein [Aquitalea magnusonii]|jgi:phospholipase/carboxylesterase|uniref:Phospholipase/carboxylesterase family protein n=1 Tax=Aquitalea magnusonii TaxID=332411 RepID=A0A3G9GFE1_9NEIS|nr:esterase [Aquitalea magnusonii]BBF86600.1 phospholipase/carboxylesterase family protein [Aquitalea magnusonii]